MVNLDGEVHDLDAERLPFLPKSVLTEVFSYLLPKDLVNLAATCSTLRKFLLLPTSTSIWTRVHKNKAHRVLEVSDLPPKAHPHLLLLRQHYYDTIDTQHAAIRQEFPAFRELAALHGVRKRVDAASTEEEITVIATWLINAVNAWRGRAHTDLLSRLPKTIKSLYLAIAIFRRSNDPRPLFYPDMLMGDPYTIKDPLKSAPDESLRYSSTCAEMATQMCNLADLDPITTTCAQFDASCVRFCCSHCAPQWPLVLNWRQALQHACHEHNDQPVAWEKWPSNTAERAIVFEGASVAWTCSQCPSSKQGLLSRPSVRLHLAERHHVSHPLEGSHFARNPGVPLSRPLTALLLHAQEVPCTVLDEDDANTGQMMWKCHHCSLFFEGTSALASLEHHLFDSHNVVLRIECALKTFRELEQKRNTGSSPPSMDHAISDAVTSSSSHVDGTVSNPWPTSTSTQTDSGLPPKPFTTISGVPKTHTTLDVLLPDGTTGKMRVGKFGDKVFGCAHCTSSKKMRDRAFPLMGVKTHLLAKYVPFAFWDATFMSVFRHSKPKPSS